jgi:hypothetical protein
VLLVLLLSLSCAVIAAITGSGRSEWGFVGFTGALVVGHLALPPRFHRLKGRRRLLEIISGTLAIVGSTTFFSGQRAHASDIVLGMCSAGFGMLALLPGVQPRLHTRYPRMFGPPG